MSRAFVKEDVPEPMPHVQPRAPLPPGAVNYMRPAGVQKLRSELNALENQRAIAEGNHADEAVRTRTLFLLNTQIGNLKERLATAKVIDPAAQPQAEVRFGARVTLRSQVPGQPEIERTLTLTGVDEADINQGLVAFSAPIAKAIQGLKAGQTARLRTGRGEETLTIVKSEYPGG